MTFDLWPISWGHVWPESRFGEPLMRSVHSRSVSGVLVSCALAFPSAWGVLISDALRSVAVALISDHWCPPFCCGCSDHWSLIIDALTQHLSRDMIRSYRSVSVAGHEVGGILLSFFFLHPVPFRYGCPGYWLVARFLLRYCVLCCAVHIVPFGVP